jgi:alpha-D-xyloside xylohydrolase
MGAEVQSTAGKQAIAQLLVYPGKDAEFDLYDDDGQSYDYEKGKGASTTRLRWNDAKGSLSATGGDKELAGNAHKLVKVIGR